MKKTGITLKDNWDNSLGIDLDNDGDVKVTALNSAFIFGSVGDLETFTQTVKELLILAGKKDEK